MLIKQERSIIPACDVTEAKYEQLVKETAGIEAIGAYKIGFTLALEIGLPRAVEIARKYTDKPLIYDHQKAATDTPHTGEAFAKICKHAGIDAIILFPQAGPETERAWIDFARDEDLHVIVGGLMTHPKYVRSEGGYIADEAIIQMYETAAGLGINDYVVPGNNPEAIKKIRAMLVRERSHPVLYSPGFKVQGGSLEASVRAAEGHFHPIVGRAIFEAADMSEAAKKICAELAEIKL